MAYDKAVDSAVLDAGLTSIADAIRQKGGTSASLTFPQGFVDAIGEISGGEDEPWVRPSDWPDIDALAVQVADDEDCVYLTYDLRKTPGYGWIGIAARNDVNNTDWYVERGHVANGAFVADETHSITTTNRNNLTYFRQALDNAGGDVQLWRVRSENHLLQVGFATNTSTNASNFNNNMQPCVERAGKAPYLVTLASSISTMNNKVAMGTVWLEHDALIPGKHSIVTTMSGMWNSCKNLHSIDVSGWDTSGWAVTSLVDCWKDCSSLLCLDLSAWNTSGWEVTNLGGTWSGCRNLIKLNIGTWDTSGWSVTNMGNTWLNCTCLEKLEINNWNTSGWAVTNLYWTWQNCRSLKELNLNSWDVSNWRVDTAPRIWQGCGELTKLGVDQWDVSEWNVTKLDAWLSGCVKLKEIGIDKWNVSGWKVDTVGSLFMSCESLENIDLSAWDTSGWVVTNASNMIYSCETIRTVKGIGAWTWLSGVSSTFNLNIATLEYTDGLPISTNHSYANCTKLTSQSLLNILNVLPTVTVARTITLGQTNKNKLTAEEIAIATAKGWTVA